MTQKTIDDIATNTTPKSNMVAIDANFDELYAFMALIKAGIFGGIHVHDGATAQAIATGAAYTKLTAFVDDSLSSNCTPDAASDKVTITVAGVYRVSGSFNFTCGTNNVIFKMAPFLGGAEQDQVHIERKVSTGTDVGSASFTGFIDVTTVPADLDARARHNLGGSVDLTISYANLNIEYVGAT